VAPPWRPNDPDHLEIEFKILGSQRQGEQFPYISYSQNIVAAALRTIVGRDIS
jgi:hypothetical protein